MEAQINHSFDDETRQIIKLEGIQEALIASCSKIDTELSRVRKRWKGKSSDEFFRNAGIIQERMKKETDEMQQVIDEIKKISKIMLEAENTSKNIAQK